MPGHEFPDPRLELRLPRPPDFEAKAAQNAAQASVTGLGLSIPLSWSSILSPGSCFCTGSALGPPP